MLGNMGSLPVDEMAMRRLPYFAHTLPSTAPTGPGVWTICSGLEIGLDWPWESWS
jgi:hypothetical protein